MIVWLGSFPDFVSRTRTSKVDVRSKCLNSECRNRNFHQFCEEHDVSNHAGGHIYGIAKLEYKYCYDCLTRLSDEERLQIDFWKFHGHVGEPYDAADACS